MGRRLATGSTLRRDRTPGSTVMPQIHRVSVLLIGSAVLVTALAATARVSETPPSAPPADEATHEATGAAPAPAVVPIGDLAACDGGVRTAPAPAVDGDVRDAAQKGLSFLERSTVQWQGQHNCYGCHVQAVTVKAMAVGRHHDYAVDDSHLRTVVEGLTTVTGGSRSQGGLRYSSGSYLSASKSLGGAAFAQYDAWIGTDLREDLLQTADELRSLQQTHGPIKSDYSHAPVAIGELQDTVLAMATWNQAYARTADDSWLTALGRAEDWLSGRVAGWGDTAPADLQQINYALMGLKAARSGTGEAATARLMRWLLDAQNTDGGWSLHRGGASEAYATGQTLYTLRTMGLTETDPAVAQGTKWLLQRQGEDGGWSHSGRERAEAMWAVLGLVSVDVLTLAVTGLEDGAHVAGVVPVRAVATDNEGGAVVQVELRVDDVPVHRACGDTLQWDWSTASLGTGPHVVDLVALNDAGNTAVRRVTVYSGEHYLTRVASHYEDGGTVFTLRNVAPEDRQATVKLTVHAVAEADGVERPGDEIAVMQRDATQGPMRFHWDGKGASGAMVTEDRLFARLSWVEGERVVQTEELLFVHDSPEAQRGRYAEVGGQLRLQGAGGANTRVELVDKAGRVISSTVTTEEGQYRFKNVRSGDYKVRVNKEGWGAQEADVQAGPEAAAESVDLDL